MDIIQDIFASEVEKGMMVAVRNRKRLIWVENHLPAARDDLLDNSGKMLLSGAWKRHHRRRSSYSIHRAVVKDVAKDSTPK